MVESGGSRNGAGFHLACQLRDERFTFEEAEPYLYKFADAVAGLDHPYTHQEIYNSAVSAYASSPVHLARHAEAGPDGLLFFGTSSRDGAHSYLRRSNFYKRVWKPALKAAGLPHFRFHDLRHAGATLYAQTGATLAELMTHVGHSTPSAAMRYQHAGQERMEALGDRLDELVPSPAATGTDNVVPITPTSPPSSRTCSTTSHSEQRRKETAMTAPNVLAPEQTTPNTDHYFTKRHEGNIPPDILILLRNLQTQITALEARVAVLETP